MNDLPQGISPGSKIALFADDTKLYREVATTEDIVSLQQDVDYLGSWCNTWRMDLSPSKCTIMSITRNIHKINYQYHLLGHPLQSTNNQKDLGIITTNDLKWSSHVYSIVPKANKILGFVRRSAYLTKNEATRWALYLSLVRSKFSYCSQVWAPQTVGPILHIEQVQRRATKFILSLPYNTDVTYSQRLATCNFLDLTFLYKPLKTVTNKEVLCSLISIHKPSRFTRSCSADNGLNLSVSKTNTVTFQSSYFCRVTRTWNALPTFLNDISKSVAAFKKDLYNFYFHLWSDWDNFWYFWP